MPDQSRHLRIQLAAAAAAVLLLCTVACAALGDAPWSVVPALLVATAVYGVLAWLRLGRVGRQS